MAYLRAKSQFDSHYCDLLIAHMSQGFSFESFGADVGVSLYVLNRWLAEYPDFAEAKAIGESHSRKRWEGIGIAATLGKIPNFNIGAYKMQVQNRFKGEYGDQATGLNGVVMEGEAAKDDDGKLDPVQFYLPDNGRRAAAKDLPPSKVIIDIDLDESSP